MHLLFILCPKLFCILSVLFCLLASSGFSAQGVQASVHQSICHSAQSGIKSSVPSLFYCLLFRLCSGFPVIQSRFPACLVILCPAFCLSAVLPQIVLFRLVAQPASRCRKRKFSEAVCRNVSACRPVQLSAQCRLYAGQCPLRHRVPKGLLASCAPVISVNSAVYILVKRRKRRKKSGEEND